MASLLLHFRSHNHHNITILRTTSTFTFSHSFSSSSSSSSTVNPNHNGNDENNETNSTNNGGNRSSISSYFSDVKASLKQQQEQQQKQSSISSYFSDVKASLKQQLEQQHKQSSFHNPPPKVASFDEIRKNLSEFRRRSSAPAPAPAPAQENVVENGGDAARAGGRLSFEAIRESLRQRRNTKNERGRNVSDSMSLSKYTESFKLRPSPMGDGGNANMVIGGTALESLPSSVFGKEMKERERRREEGQEGKVEGDDLSRTELIRMYNYQELGERLRTLRPEDAKKKGGENWFSLGELNERLRKLREVEEREAQANVQGVSYKDLRESLLRLRISENENKKKTSMQTIDILGQLGGTPSFMLSPPKEHLVEKYFHPDNMSSAEKLKLELKRVRDEFKMSESDCGSTRVQIAQLTTEINHLSAVLHKKDKHSRRGLLAKVQQRKSLLKYLRRTDWDSYCFVLSKLGLRDSPDYRT